MTIKDRVLEYCNIKGIAISTFERMADLSNGYFKKTSRFPHAAKRKQISCAFPDLNMSWLISGEGEMLNPEPNGSVHINQDHNTNSTMFGYVNIDVPEKDKQKILNADGIVVETDGCTNKQIQHYRDIIDSKDEQISRLLSIIEEKDKLIASIMERM